MKKPLKITALVSFVLIIGLLGACKGPAGPAGPAGQNGASGQPGVSGPAGPSGSVNVFYSSWTRAGNWTPITTNGVQRAFVDVSAPRLSQEILDRGVVLVYAKLETDNNQVRPLPVRVFAQFTEEMIDFSLNVGRIRIWSTQIRPPVPPSANNQFRYVLVPGGQALRINYESLPYEQAKVLFGLPD